MIKVVLADDDYLVRETIKDAINWKELGMELTALAADGQEALDICLKEQPDILLADIRMPLLNGLEVAARMLENDLHTRVIFVSGIHDFDYARTALNIQAAGYILKPIQLGEVRASLKKIRDDIEIELDREQKLRKMQDKLNENIPLARVIFLRNLVLGADDNSEKLDEKLEYLKLPFQNNDEITVAAAEIDDYQSLIQNKSEAEIVSINFIIKGFIDQVLDNYQAGSCFMRRDGEYIILLNRKYAERHKISLILENIAEILNKYDRITLSIGIGHTVNRFGSVNISYREAESALKNKFFTGPGSIIHFEDIAETKALNKTINDNDNIRKNYLRAAIIGSIHLGNEKSIADMMKEYFSFIAGSGDLSKEYICSQFLELIIAAYHDFCKTEGEVPEIFKWYVESMGKIFQAETMPEIKNQTASMILATVRYFNDKYSRRNMASVVRIKDYIIKMRNKNISLNDIAKEVYLSPNYMCAVFKRETGQTINEYIIADKMNCAKELLQSTKMKIFEIAEHLGYESPHYFSYSFKRYTGLTPHQYRSEKAV